MPMEWLLKRPMFQAVSVTVGTHFLTSGANEPVEPRSQPGCLSVTKGRCLPHVRSCGPMLWAM